jgi:glyoxylate/hydroxypyruvate reductase A
VTTRFVAPHNVRRTASKPWVSARPVLMSAILLAIMGWDPKNWDQLFRTLAPQRDFRLWPEQAKKPDDIAYACVWKPPHGLMAEHKNLKAIFSLGAGVDDLLADTTLPDVPIVRVIDADLTMRMTEYVVLHVLMYHRRQRLYDSQQRVRMWHEHEQPAANEVSVGIMGLGELGYAAAIALQRLGFKVHGWSRTQKIIPGVETFYGSVGFEPFLRRTEILVSLLPSTPSTRGILNLDTFRRLKFNGAMHGAYLINAARGDLQVDADIIVALEEGTLAGATLDVFPIEPLPITSPLWTHPKVTVTPHSAAQSSPRAIVANVLRQIERVEAGLPLEHVVDRRRGY